MEYSILSMLKKSTQSPLALENNICIGLKIPIGAKLTLTQKLGLGVVSFHGVDRSIQQKISRKLDFSQIIYAGFSYQI